MVVSMFNSSLKYNDIEAADIKTALRGRPPILEDTTVDCKG
jgi:hypothetical protein